MINCKRSSFEKTLLQSEIKFKPILMLLLAANALLIAGIVVGGVFNLFEFLLLQWCGICGIFMVYRFNDVIDQSSDIRVTIRVLFKNKLNAFFFLQFLFISFPVFLYVFSIFRIVALLSILILGIVYSVKFRVNGQSFRLKNVFLVKNLMIGMLWGGLVLSGADTIQNEDVLVVFVFTSLQVFIGSVIRDFPDIARDEAHSVNTLPVTLGTTNSLFILHVVNVASPLIVVLILGYQPVIIGYALVVIWRFIGLLKLQQQPNSTLWAHSLNLVTCFLILILSMVYYLHA